MASLIDINTFNTLKESTGDDFMGELISTFLEDAPNLILQMQNALEKRDPESFRRAAHSMKSNAATFGAMQLSAMAKELEGLARANDLNIGNKLELLKNTYAQTASELKKL